MSRSAFCIVSLSLVAGGSVGCNDVPPVSGATESGTSSTDASASTTAGPSTTGTGTSSSDGTGPRTGSTTRIVGSATNTGTDASSTGETTTVDRAAAFPEACGYGAHPRDWSDAARVVVTNLDDAGPGSFRDAMRTEGKRIVTFAVGGTIQLESLILVDTPRSDVYVAGQTAPGDGIAVLGPTASGGHVIRFRGTEDGNFDNAIVRFLSFRGRQTEAASGDVMAVQTSTNFVLDHCSLAFSSDEILGFTGLSCAWPQFAGGSQHDIGVTNNLVAEPFEPHTTAALFATLPSPEEQEGCPSVTPYVLTPPAAPPFDAAVPHQGARNAWPSREGFHRLTIHRNLFSAATHRMPLLSTVDTSHTNNIAYGAEIGTLLTQGAAEVDSVGNLYLVHAEVIESPGYATFLQQRMLPVSGNRYDLDNPGAFFDLPPSIHMAATYLETAPNVGGLIDPWATEDGAPLYWEELVGSTSHITNPPNIFEGNWPCDGTDWRCNLNAERTEPLHHPDGSEDSPYACEVDLQPGPRLEAEILEDVGNSRRIDCAGDWQPRRQPTDVRQVADVANRTDSVGGADPIGEQGGTTYPQLASISPLNIEQVGGYDSLEGGRPCPDDDDDGMPNAFEERYGLSLGEDDALLDPDGDGYTNLEEWFNGTAPQ